MIICNNVQDQNNVGKWKNVCVDSACTTIEMRESSSGEYMLYLSKVGVVFIGSKFEVNNHFHTIILANTQGQKSYTIDNIAQRKKVEKEKEDERKRNEKFAAEQRAWEIKEKKKRREREKEEEASVYISTGGDHIWNTAEWTSGP